MSLNQAVEHLITQIQNYESDTFSASEYGVDRAMAEQIAEQLIYQLLFDEDGCPGAAVDGAEIGFAMDTILERAIASSNDPKQ